MEDSLFPLSPTDGQRLGEDSMECTAADLLLGETDGGGFFNDSLEEDGHMVAKTAGPAALADSGPAQEQRDLDDSLDFDATQLPFENETCVAMEAAGSQALPASSGDTASDEPMKGFELAQNISGSCPRENKTKAAPAGEGENQAEELPETSTPNDGDKTKTSSDTCSNSAAKTSKVVPSFGRRKTKTHTSPEAITVGAKSSDKESASDSDVPAGNQMTDERSLPKEGEEIEGDEGERKGDDQCVPESSQKTGKTQKPQFGTASKNKHLPKKATTTTKSRERKQSTAQKRRNQSKVSTTDGADSQNMTNKSECLPNSNTTSSEVDPTENGHGLLTDKNPTGKHPTNAEKKEKRLAKQEEKKQERGEKKKEAERKKFDREQKKREAEAKKAEKERLKKERQLELEKKKAEREQRKIEQALKKAEQMAGKKEAKQSGARSSKKSKQRDGASSTTEGSPLRTSLAADCEEKEEQMEMELDQNNAGESLDNLSQETPEDGGVRENRDGARSVMGVTEPEEGASLPTDPSNESKHTPNGPQAASASVASTSVGYCRSPTGGQEPSESAAELPQDTADEAACNLAVSGDQNIAVGGGSGDTDGNSQNPNDAIGLVPKEKNVAGGNISGHKEGKDKENCSPKLKEASNTCSVSVQKLKIVFGKSKKEPKTDAMKSKDATNNTSKPMEAPKPTNIPAKMAPKKRKAKSTSNQIKNSGKRAPSSSSKPKKRACARDETGGSGCHGGGGEGKGKSSKSCVGPVWVQCERTSCHKWRKLRDCSDPLSLPDSWTCSMNTDPERSTCSAEEESWSEDMGECQEFVETPFVPGSLVWAKMDSYPWWPAMVEEDPDDETYYDLGKWSTSSVPVKYHVVFFDTPVSRGWVSSFHIQPYTKDTNHNNTTGVSIPQKLRQGLKEARKQAIQASSMSTTTRLAECSFSKRFRRMSSKRRRKTCPKEEEDAEFEAYTGGAKRQKASSSRESKQKSARLERGEMQREGEDDGREGEGCEGSWREAEVNLEECVGVCEDVEEVRSDEEEEAQDTVAM